MLRTVFLLLLASCSLFKDNNVQYMLVHGEHFDERIFQNLKLELGSSASLAKFPMTETSEDAEVDFIKLTLIDYANLICSQLDSLKGNVILVGHGLGGATINQAYGICPEKVKGMIYIGATIPFPGESAYRLFTDQDAESYDKAVDEDKLNGLFKVSDRFVFAAAFAQDASNEARDLLIKICISEPVGPTKTKLKFNLREYQNLTKLVIILGDDKVISPETQKRFTVRMENTEIKFLDSDHLPMLTKIDELKELIENFEDTF